jgi:hypothetical protein
VTFGLGNRCSILLSYGTKHIVDVPTLYTAAIANAPTRPRLRQEVAMDADRPRYSSLDHCVEPLKRPRLASSRQHVRGVRGCEQSRVRRTRPLPMQGTA